MIHFNFVVSDEEAVAIFSALHDEIVKCMVDKIENPDPDYVVWYESRIKFLKELEGKMLNKRVP